MRYSELAAGLPAPALPLAGPASRAGSGCWCWTPSSRPTAVRLVNWVCPPAFAAFNHVTHWPDIFLGVVLAVEPPAPPHSDIACETLPGSHRHPLLLQLCGPLVYREMRSSRARQLGLLAAENKQGDPKAAP